MFKRISAVLLLLLTVTCYGESVDSFSQGKYTFYGKLIYKSSPGHSRLVLYSGTSRQYSIALKLKSMKRAISYNNKFIVVSGNVQNASKGIETKVHNAIIVKSATRTEAVSKGFIKH